MSLLDILNRVHLMDRNLQLTLLQILQRIPNQVIKLLPGRNIVVHRRPRQLNILASKTHEILRGNRATGTTKQHQGSQPTDNVQTGLEGSLADTIKDSVDSLTVGEFADFFLEGFVAVVDEDDVFCAVGASKGSLFFGRDGADDVSSEETAELGEEEAHTSGGSVDDDPVALLDGVALADQTDSRQTLQDNCRSLVRQWVQDERLISI